MDEAGMATASIITPTEMAAYRATARRRQEREQQDLVQRQERAWEVARCAATRLKAQFGVERVMVFGSLVRSGCFTPWSDVDIATWGLSPNDTFRAIGAVLDLDTAIACSIHSSTAQEHRPTLIAHIRRVLRLPSRKLH
jgi:predicted nucleotidyltransferase